jgi:signal transduction histidine kinase
LGGGAGLGLSIAKRAVQVHHGAITAENASPGLRVRIKIPSFKTTMPDR